MLNTVVMVFYGIGLKSHTFESVEAAVIVPQAEKDGIFLVFLFYSMTNYFYFTLIII